MSEEKKDDPEKRTGVHLRGRKKGVHIKPLDQCAIYKTFSISCTPAEKDEILRLAAGSGKTVSRYVVDTILGLSKK